MVIQLASNFMASMGNQLLNTLADQFSGSVHAIRQRSLVDSVLEERIYLDEDLVPSIIDRFEFEADEASYIADWNWKNFKSPFVQRSIWDKDSDYDPFYRIHLSLNDVTTWSNMLIAPIFLIGSFSLAGSMIGLSILEQYGFISGMSDYVALGSGAAMMFSLVSSMSLGLVGQTISLRIEDEVQNQFKSEVFEGDVTTSILALAHLAQGVPQRKLPEQAFAELFYKERYRDNPSLYLKKQKQFVALWRYFQQFTAVPYKAENYNEYASERWKTFTEGYKIPIDQLPGTRRSSATKTPSTSGESSSR